MAHLYIDLEGNVKTYEDVQKVLNSTEVQYGICKFISECNIDYRINPTKDFKCQVTDHAYLKMKDASKIHIFVTPVGKGYGNGVCINPNGIIICGKFNDHLVEKVTFYGHYNKPTAQLNGFLFEEGYYVNKNIMDISLKEIKENFQKNNKTFNGLFSTESTLDNLLKEEGLYHISNETSYFGSFVDNKFDGYGKILDNEAVFVGMFANGKKNGFGVLTKSNGEKEQGTWRDDNKVVYANEKEKI